MLYKVKIEQFGDTELLYKDTEFEQACITLQNIKEHIVKDEDGKRQRVTLQAMTEEEIAEEAENHRKIMESIRAAKEEVKND